MKLHRWLCVASLCLSLACITGCGSEAKVNVEGNKTMGQELKDLDDAHSKGIINREEYEKAKKRIIEGR